MNAQIIGRHHGKNKIIKVLGLIYRAFQLNSIIRKEKPELALSHGSRAQLILSNILKIESVLITDYEHAKGIPLAYPSWAIVPEIIPSDRFPFHAHKIVKYPGIKEDVYIPNFTPDNAIYSKLDIENETENILITIRPPAIEAHYHNPQSEILFESSINYLLSLDNIIMVILPRSNKQNHVINSTWNEAIRNKKIIIPSHALDGINLIWHSDLVISGGGTMNREAAALGVPVYSIFRGKIGAVDRYLSESGRLILIETVGDIKDKIQIEKRKKILKHEFVNKPALNSIVNSIIKIYNS
jgi:predicted glycosyltransferase